ncbi:O-antigen ligase family protein [Bradyrhizobium sp. LTSPM299]|uniref:O-antigen ligase family protein n=1 Tax=Bradyrhizobium sp. LTSPM299 TaxID=1619233 RepID=UPI000678B913|nr:O-antigen ligase family protein [Bradyrhizobium sp. LTSPM299]
MTLVRETESQEFRWRYFVCGFLILHVIGAFGSFSRLYYGEFQGGFTATTKLAVIFNLGFVTACIFLFFGRIRRAAAFNTGELLAISLASFFLISTAWSNDPATTLRRGGLFAFFVLGVIGVAADLTDTQFVRLVYKACLLCAFASIVVVVVSPSNGLGVPEFFDTTSDITDSFGWRGIFSQKNALGQVMAFGALASAHSIRAAASAKMRFWGIANSTLFLAVAVASRSSTSILVILLLYSATLIILLYRRGGFARFLGVSVVALLLLGILTFALSPDIFFELMGKDATLTGRTELWELVQAEISRRPIIGWGYFAFWTPANPTALEISAQLGWLVPHAHNGILEMLLELGVTGTLLMLVVFFRSIWCAWRCTRTSSNELGISSLLTCGAVIITGITESVLLDFSGGWTIAFFVLWIMCESRATKERNSRRTYHQTNFRGKTASFGREPQDHRSWS